jgi:hypothetical protein
MKAEDALRPKRSGTHYLGLQRHAIAVAARDVHHGRDALLASQCHGRQGRHPRLACMVVGKTDQIDGIGERRDPFADTQGIRRTWQGNLGRSQRGERHPERLTPNSSRQRAIPFA